MVLFFHFPHIRISIFISELLTFYFVFEIKAAPCSWFIQPMPTFWKSGSKGKKKKLAFLEILCKYGNYLCKHGIPLYKQEIILQYELKVLFYIFSNFFPSSLYLEFFHFHLFFSLYFNFKMILRILLFLSIFPYILLLKCLKFCDILFIFPYFPLYFTFKIFRILSFFMYLFVVFHIF